VIMYFNTWQSNHFSDYGLANKCQGFDALTTTKTFELSLSVQFNVNQCLLFVAASRHKRQKFNTLPSNWNYSYEL